MGETEGRKRGREGKEVDEEVESKGDGEGEGRRKERWKNGREWDGNGKEGRQGMEGELKTGRGKNRQGK